MARICPALQQLINTKEISTPENLSSTPRRKPIKWTVNIGVDRRLFTITATIERMNRRIGAGLPLSTMAKRDGKHKSGMPVAVTAVKTAPTKTPNAPKVKAPKPVKAKAPKPAAKVKTTKTKRGIKVASSTATAKDVADAANKAAGQTVAYATSTTKPQVILALDASGSMQGIEDAAQAQYTAIVDAVRTKMPTASVSALSFNSVVSEIKPVAVPQYPYCTGSTSLLDAVVKLANSVTIDTPTLIYMITDGEESGSAASQHDRSVIEAIAKLTKANNVTLAFVGPPAARSYLSRLGIPDTACMTWDGGAASLIAKVVPKVVAGIEATATALKEGKKSLAHFFLDIDAVSLQDAAKKCVDVTATMERRNTVQGGLAVREYIEKHCKLYTYVDGAYFYKLVTKEKVLKDRRIVIAHRDDTTGKLYSGPAARTLLGLPVDADVEVEPGSLGKWTVFVQSASPTRKTVRDAEFLWDKTATGNVKATFEYKAKKA